VDHRDAIQQLNKLVAELSLNVAQLRADVEQLRKTPTPKQFPPGVRHSPDFRTVTWTLAGVEETFSFTQMQSAAVKVLYELWAAGAGASSHEYVLSTVGSDCRSLHNLFRVQWKRDGKGGMVRHPALNRLIVQGPIAGTVKLVDPS
jgi:hypothetical protein